MALRLGPNEHEITQLSVLHDAYKSLKYNDTLSDDFTEELAELRGCRVLGKLLLYH